MVQLEIAQTTLEKLIQAGRRTEMFQAWAHLVGEMPPVNNAELVRRTEYGDAHFGSLGDAHACFKGVQRRYDDDDNGTDIYVYVIRTGFTVRWRPDMRTMVGFHPAPEGALLTVQAKPRGALHGCQVGVWGAVVKWEFVNADPERTEYPDGFDTRYDTLVWQR